MNGKELFITISPSNPDPMYKQITDQIKDAVAAMEKMKTQFFIKTNFALPPTKACLKDAVEVQSLAASGDLDQLADALARLKENVEKLLRLSKMEGVALT